MNMSLHHVADLEGFFLKLQKLLKLNGMLIINEYIGPSQMQFTKKQISIVNRLLGILSDKYKYDYVLKQMKCRYVMKSRSEWDQLYPSEAVRSDDIAPLLQKYFNLVKRVDYGGTLLNPLLEHIVGNLSNNSDDELTILKLLMFIEETLIDEKVLTSDFAILALKKINR